MSQHAEHPDVTHLPAHLSDTHRHIPQFPRSTPPPGRDLQIGSVNKLYVNNSFLTNLSPLFSPRYGPLTAGSWQPWTVQWHCSP